MLSKLTRVVYSSFGSEGDGDVVWEVKRRQFRSQWWGRQRRMAQAVVFRTYADEQSFVRTI